LHSNFSGAKKCKFIVVEQDNFNVITAYAPQIGLEEQLFLTKD